MDVRIYDPPEAGTPTFRVAGRVTACTELDLVERLWATGTFTLTVPAGARHADKLTVGRLVAVGTFWGILDDLERRFDGGGDYLTLSGRQLKGLTDDRITLPPAVQGVVGAQGYDTAAGTTEAVMKHFVSANLGAGAAADRAVLGLEVAADRGRGLAQDQYISRHDVLTDVLSALGEASGLGYDIVPDLGRHRLVFDVIAGEDHTAGQSDRKRVIFDVGRKTALSQVYQYGGRDSRNLFYATLSGAEFADEALTALYVREGEAVPAGIRRREKHLSLSAGTPTAGEEYDELKRLALIEAEGFRAAESFTSEVAEGPYVYGADYRLGDLVTVQNQGWGVRMDARLTEMETRYDGSGVRHTATFGTAPLNVFGRLQRQITKGK